MKSKAPALLLAGLSFALEHCALAGEARVLGPEAQEGCAGRWDRLERETIAGPVSDLWALDQLARIALPAKLALQSPRPAPPAPEERADGETSAGWTKSGANPVLGGDLGTCFDVSLLREGDRFRMWFSWRPRRSLALVESADGIRWSRPAIVLGPEPSTGWEEDINRPVVIRRPDGYHLWYTGQAKGHSWIGYATSPDGVAFKWMREGRRGDVEQIGLALHEGEDLGF